MIRTARKNFKRAANSSVPDHNFQYKPEKLPFCTEKKQQSSRKEIPQYITRLKKERNQFFLDNNDRYNVSNTIKDISISKEYDVKLHLKLGM